MYAPAAGHCHAKEEGVKPRAPGTAIRGKGMVFFDSGWGRRTTMGSLMNSTLVVALKLRAPMIFKNAPALPAGR